MSNTFYLKGKFVEGNIAYSTHQRVDLFAGNTGRNTIIEVDVEGGVDLSLAEKISWRVLGGGLFGPAIYGIEKNTENGGIDIVNSSVFRVNLTPQDTVGQWGIFNHEACIFTDQGLESAKNYSAMLGRIHIKRAGYRMQVESYAPESPYYVAVPFGTYIPVLEKVHLQTEVDITDHLGKTQEASIVWDYEDYDREKVGSHTIKGKIDLPTGFVASGDFTGIVYAAIEVLNPAHKLPYAGTAYCGQDYDEVDITQPI